MKMHFLPELADFLRDHGRFYTVRSYKVLSGVVVVDGIGPCERLPVKLIQDYTSLEPYVEMSGFKSLDAWAAKIRKFIRPCGSWYLYEVTVA